MYQATEIKSAHLLPMNVKKFVTSKPGIGQAQGMQFNQKTNLKVQCGGLNCCLSNLRALQIGCEPSISNYLVSKTISTSLSCISAQSSIQ